MKNFISYGQGALPDQPDLRDHIYEQAFGAPMLTEAEWEQGYDVEEEFDVKLKQENQGSSSSCVGQSVSKLFELKLIEKYGKDYLKDYSARWIYANVSLGAGQGAYIREGMKWAANFGCAEETHIPSYENGQPPSEQFMLRKDDMTPHIYDLAKRSDVFDYRVIEGKNIDTIAHAIKTHKGVVLGFTGSNEGWKTGKVRPPQTSETTWGHAVIATRFGKENGKRYIGGANSWNGWGLGGYWLMLEDGYFTVDYNIFNPWVFVWSDLIPDNIRAMEYLRQNENKLVQNGQTGEIGLIKGGEVLVTSPERAGLLALTTLIRDGQGGAVSDELWQQFPRKPF